MSCLLTNYWSDILRVCTGVCVFTFHRSQSTVGNMTGWKNCWYSWVWVFGCSLLVHSNSLLLKSGCFSGWFGLIWEMAHGSNTANSHQSHAKNEHTDGIKRLEEQKHQPIFSCFWFGWFFFSSKLNKLDECCRLRVISKNKADNILYSSQCFSIFFSTNPNKALV